MWRGRGYVVGVDDDLGGASEDAYGRVSDPGRYAGLHVAMDSLLERVEREYLGERAQGLELDHELAGRAPVDLPGRPHDLA